MNGMLTIWRFLDGRPGHENQSRGLVQALEERTVVRVEDIRIGPRWQSVRDWLLHRNPGVSVANMRPDLLIGAGSGTHFPMLSARRATGAPAIVLMAPPIPMRRWFDLCIVPEHDELARPNVIVTRGALTAIRPGGTHDPDSGLFLIGGACPHHDWDEGGVVTAIETLCRAHPDKAWKLTTSRRTPATTLVRLNHLNCANLEVIPHDQTDKNWVPQALADSGYVFVTEDSISMIYESLTAGAATGVLPLPVRKRPSRVERLFTAGFIHRFDGTGTLPRHHPRPGEFDESSRIAQFILDRFFLQRRASA